jgi:hypothetical protein
MQNRKFKFQDICRKGLFSSRLSKVDCRMVSAELKQAHTYVSEQGRQRRAKTLRIKSSTSFAVFTAIHVLAIYGIPSESLAIDVSALPIQKSNLVQPRILSDVSPQPICSRISLHLRGGGSRSRIGLQNSACKQDGAEIHNSFTDGLQLLAALPLQVRYLLSLGVGNALYFLLYTVMLAYATNTLERAACMFFSYGGNVFSLIFVCIDVELIL